MGQPLGRRPAPKKLSRLKPRTSGQPEAEGAPEADVEVAGDQNQVRKAIAIQYDPGEPGVRPPATAPTVVASGEGALADFILRVAEEHGIAVRKDAPLAEALGPLTVGSVIPPELYEAVAEVLAFVYELDQHAEKRRAVMARRTNS